MRILLLSLLVALTACSPRPIKEGAVRFVYYEVSPDDVRKIFQEAPEKDHKTPEGSFERWSAEPYVKLYPDYVEIRYVSTEAKKPEDKLVTHVIPTSRLRFLRWASSH